MTRQMTALRARVESALTALIRAVEDRPRHEREQANLLLTGAATLGLLTIATALSGQLTASWLCCLAGLGTTLAVWEVLDPHTRRIPRRLVRPAPARVTQPQPAPAVAVRRRPDRAQQMRRRAALLAANPAVMKNEFDRIVAQELGLPRRVPGRTGTGA